MKKKRAILIGMAIGMFARPVIKQAYQPFRDQIRQKIYNIAFDYIQNFDAERPS